jgi:hypothetical protein
VFREEPPPATDRFWRHPVTLTPHIAMHVCGESISQTSARLRSLEGGASITSLAGVVDPNRLLTPASPHVKLVDVGPDGPLQNEKRRCPRRSRSSWHRLQAGLKEIEVTSLCRPNGAACRWQTPPMMAGLTRRPGVPLGALTPNLQA